VSMRKYFKELRLQQFRALLEVGRHKSFTAAARALNLSRTSVWQQIRSLEEDFGVELVAVREQHPQLTADGQLLIEMVAPLPLLDEFDAMKNAFLSKLKRLKRKVTVATTTSILNYELRAPVAAFRRKFPDISLSFVDRTSSAAIDLLLTAGADLAVVGRVESLQNEKSLMVQRVLNYPFVVACPENHALAGLRTLRVQDIASFPLIVPSVGTNARKRIDDVFKHAGITDLQIMMESNSASVLLSYVDQNLGPALTSISPELLKQNKSNYTFKDVSSIFGEEEVVIVRRKIRFELPHVKEFAEFILGTKK
jgi:DNA-binding transcriptional LysR family regulator